MLRIPASSFIRLKTDRSGKSTMPPVVTVALLGAYCSNHELDITGNDFEGRYHSRELKDMLSLVGFSS